MQNKVPNFNKYLRIIDSPLFPIFIENQSKNLLNEALSLKTQFLSHHEITKCLVVRGEGKTYRPFSVRGRGKAPMDQSESL